MIYYERDGLLIRDSVLADVAAMQDHLRREDAEEVIASGFASTEHALGYSFAVSAERFTVEQGGVPVAMFGCIPTGTFVCPSANVWLLGTEDLAKIKKSFVKLSRKWVANFVARHQVVFGFVDARYQRAVTWLESCGAVFEAPQPHGEHGAAFVKFEIRRA